MPVTLPTAAAAVLVALAAVAAAWVPGAVVLRLAGVRGLALAGAAPAATTGVLAATAVVSAGLGVRWGLPVAVVGTALVAGVLRAATRGSRRLTRPVATAPGRGREPGRDGPRTLRVRPAVIVAVAVGVLLQLVPLAAVGGAGRLVVAHDAVTHLTSLAAIRAAGNASSLAFWSVAAPVGTPAGPYAAGWHAVASLVPPWPDAVTATNALTFVPTATAWTVGLVALTARCLPAHPRAQVWAGVLSAGGGAVPLVLVLRPEGMVPNAFALALLPGALALVAPVRGEAAPAPWPRALVALVVLASVAAAHPGSLLTAGVLLLPTGLAHVTRLIVRRSWPGLAVACAAALALAVAAWGASASPAGARVLAYPPEDPEHWTWALTWLASGDLTRLGPAAGFAVVAAALVGGILARRLPHAAWLGGAAVAVAALYLAATSSVPVLTDVDRLWYGEPRRFGPALLIAVVPLAALALDVVPRWALTTGRVRTDLPRRATAVAIAAAVVLPGAVGGAVGLARGGRDTLAPETVGLSGFADPDELAMMHRLRGVLDPDRAVLGSPFSGAAHLAAVADQRVLLPTTVDVDDERLTGLVARLSDLGLDPGVCASLADVGVGYLYVDPTPWGGSVGPLDVVTAPEGTRTVDAGGGAAVVEVTAC